jgi:hypothetical protein
VFPRYSRFQTPDGVIDSKLLVVSIVIPENDTGNAQIARAAD